MPRIDGIERKKRPSRDRQGAVFVRLSNDERKTLLEQVELGQGLNLSDLIRRALHTKGWLAKP